MSKTIYQIPREETGILDLMNSYVELQDSALIDGSYKTSLYNLRSNILSDIAAAGNNYSIQYNKTGVLSGSTDFLFTENIKTNGAFYLGTTNPNGTKRLNYDGYFHATSFTANGVQLLPFSNAVSSIFNLSFTSPNLSLTYLSTKTSGAFYTGTDNPSSTTRLNYDGNFYASNLYSIGNVYAGGVQLTSNLGTVTDVNAGDGLEFTTITTSGNITLGTPSTISDTSVNGVSTNSHTHTLDISLSKINNVNLTSPTNGQVLTYDSGNWINSVITTLSNISDDTGNSLLVGNVTTSGNVDITSQGIDGTVDINLIAKGSGNVTVSNGTGNILSFVNGATIWSSAALLSLGASNSSSIVIRSTRIEPSSQSVHLGDNITGWPSATIKNIHMGEDDSTDTTRTIDTVGAESNINLILQPKGTGTVQTSSAHTTNISNNDDIITKGYADLHYSGVTSQGINGTLNFADGSGGWSPSSLTLGANTISNSSGAVGIESVQILSNNIQTVGTTNLNLLTTGTGANIILKPVEDGRVEINNGNIEIAFFENSTSSDTDFLRFFSGTNGIRITSSSSNANSNISIEPKGTGTVQTTNEHTSNISLNNDIITKGYADLHYSSTGNNSLSGLTDVTITSVQEGNILVYDNGSSKWINSNIINGNLTISGDFYVSGTTVTVNATDMNVFDNIILVNSGETGSGVSLTYAGIEVDRGTLDNYRFVLDDSNTSNPLFKIGAIGDYQAVATRQDSPISSGVTYWNDTEKRFDTNSNLIFDNSSLKITGNLYVDGMSLGTTTNVVYFDNGTGQLTYGAAPTGGTLTINNNILEWDSGNSYYRPYTTRTNGSFYTGTSNPISTTRLNYDGNFYSYGLYAATSTSSMSMLGGQFIINIGGTNRTIFQPNVTDGAGAVAYSFDTNNLLGTSGSKILSLKNQNSEKFYIDYNGFAYSAGSAYELTSTSNTASNGRIAFYSGNRYTLGGDSYLNWISGTDILQTRGRFNSMEVDGASTVAFTFDTDNIFSTSGSKLLSLRNNTTEKFYIDYNGNPFIPNLTSNTTSNVIYFNSSTGQLTYGAAPTGGTSINFGTDNQIPFTNSAGDDYDYYTGLEYNYVYLKALSTSGNVAIGNNIANSSVNNTILGHNIGASNNGINQSILIGYNVASTANSSTTAGSIIGIGNNSLRSITTGSYNTCLGNNTGYALTVGEYNVFLGNEAGRYETGSNKLFIDNQSRTDESTSRTSSLVYGIFDTTPSNQLFRINSKLELPLISSNTTSNVLYFDSTTGNVTYGAAPTGGSGTTESYQSTGSTTFSTLTAIDAYPNTKDFATYFYSVSDGTNKRAGTITIVNSSSSALMNESSTSDIGDTSGVTFSTAINGGNVELRAVATSGTWTCKFIKNII